MRNIYTNMTLCFYIKVSQIDHNKKYHRVKLVRKSKCNEYEAPYCRIISPHRLVTSPTN
jgi:hypothetical protein